MASSYMLVASNTAKGAIFMLSGAHQVHLMQHAVGAGEGKARSGSGYDAQQGNVDFGIRLGLALRLSRAK